MAKAFIYDSVDLLNSTLVDGVITGTTFNPAGDQLTNEERAIDQSIGSIVSSWALNDALRIDLGPSPGEPNIIAVLFNVTENDEIKIYAGNHATDLTSSIERLNMDAGFTRNIWRVTTFDSGPGNVRYYFIRSTTAGGLVGLVEIIIGTKYTFDVNFQLGDDEYDRPLVDVVTSYGGQEYANKRADMKREFAWEWEVPTAAIKASLKSFKTDVDGNFKKFLFYNDEDSIYYWVRMSAGSLKFKRKAYDFWTTNVKLTQQLQ